MSRRRSLWVEVNVGDEAVEHIEGGRGAAKRRMALMILKNFWLGGFFRQTDSQARDII
ncbi:hypothetical protein IGI04_037152 [Brassica rapa subsp. trilocularis]|uniref:Uncharacterized protein n=1 Tax=Brassica rapa subsp. trilocularis TaxID=1813537 RepID=A0ABQ7LGI1_BRACM|nr:hypothetical protein IGI04_037152 [Brassica rapa subsp. trilocularis]